MNGAVLIIGSLLWDKDKYREAWRDGRLDLDRSQVVDAPIEYGRLSSSRGSTYTMTLSGAPPDGRGVLVPFKSSICNIDSMVTEAEQLWLAEQKKASAGLIGASWGVVGALFREGVSRELTQEWSKVFRNKANSVVSPVNDSGVLEVPWPQYNLGDLVDVDIILATATKRASQKPTPKIVAEAWVKNNYENYFFENVKAGIRTPEDVSIWKHIEAAEPDWLNKDEYSEPIGILQDEVRNGV